MIISTLNIGTDLKNLREDYLLSQKELAEICGMEMNSISKIELGKSSPSITSIVKIVNGIRSTTQNHEEVMFLDIKYVKPRKKTKKD